MKTVLILAPYCSLPGEPRFNRFLFLAYKLSDAGFKVTLVTSRFRHSDKCFRELNLFSDSNKREFDIVMLEELGYSKNLSFARYLSIISFARNFKKWFLANNDFDIVYSAFPSVETNVFLSKLRTLGSSGFKYIVDIQDIWPDSITSAIPILRYWPQWLLPFSKKANFVYRSADALLAVSQTYLDRALSVASPQFCDKVYIGSDFNVIQQVKAHQFGNENIRIFYLGAIGNSYDLDTAIKGVKNLASNGYKVELHIFGSGPDVARLQKIAGSETIFHGYLPYRDMFAFAKGCHIALNPIRQHAAQSVTNKLSDYLSLGCPILNSQCNDEVKVLLSGRLHANYTAGNVESIQSAIKKLLGDERLLQGWAPDERFNRDVGYNDIVELLSAFE